jgi:hypothetical protein
MCSKYFEAGLYDLGGRIRMRIFIVIKIATIVIAVAIANTGNSHTYNKDKYHMSKEQDQYVLRYFLDQYEIHIIKYQHFHL